ncbi:MAG: O-antigen ligase [Patescibacteria group bacterium]
MFAFLRQNKNSFVSAIKILLYLSLLSPLVVGINYLYPFVFPKAIFFMAVIELALALYLLLLVVDKNCLPRLNILVVGLAGWFSVLAVSSFLAVDPSLAFWSKAERMDGLFWYLHLFAFFVMVVGLFKNEIVKFLTINSLIGVIVGLAALISKFLPGIFNLGNQDRLAGTFGNPAFSGTYFLVLFFLNLLAYFLSQDSWKKLFLGLAGFSFILIFLTGTRGAYVGAVGGLVLSGSLVLFFSGKKYLKPVLIGLAVFGLVLASFWFLPGLWQKISPFLASRIYALWQIPKPRLIAWQIGWNAFLARPVLGWGLENFLYAFNQHFIPEIHTYEIAIFDRPHNKIIDLLVGQGIIGLLSYLFLFGAISFSFLKFLWQDKEDNQKVLVYSLFLGLLGAYFVQNLVLFEMPSSGIVFFVILALAYWLIQEQRSEVRIVKNSRTLSFSGLIIGLGLIGLSFYYGVFLPEQSARNTANTAFALAPTANPNFALKQAKEYYLKARGAGTYLNKEVDISLSRKLKDFATLEIFLAKTPEYQELALLIAENLKKDLQLHPWDYDIAVEAGSLFMQTEEDFSDKLSSDSQAYNLFLQATDLAPKREDAYQYLFLWAMRNNKQVEAKTYSDILLGLNDQIGVFWFYQAEHEARWGSLEKMEQARAKAKEHGYDISRRLSDWELLISSLILGAENGGPEASQKGLAAIKELEQITQVPGLPINFLIRDYTFLIQLYKKQGQRERAKTTIKELLTKIPKSEEQNLIKYLKQNSAWIE